MNIKFEGFGEKDKGNTVRLKIGVRQSIKIGFGLVIGMVLATALIYLVAISLGVSILCRFIPGLK